MHEILIDSVERPFRGSVHALLLVIPRDYAVNFSLKLLPPRFLEELVVDSVVVQQHSDQFVAFSENGVLDGEEAVAVAERGERMVGEEAASHFN